ncbi:MAG: hypothetical protein ACRDSR_08625 [Pseudonocardiaceae bacterium]
MRVPRTEDPCHFLDLAFGYYLTGRFAAINQLNIAPNLIHHAVELLIKFTLLKDVSENQRSAATTKVGKGYGHDLDKLWAEYKRTVACADLVRFDPVIANLHRWERLRYGGFPEGTTIVRSVGIIRGQLSVSHIKAIDTYAFGLHEVDALFAAMIAASYLNPAFIGGCHRHKTQLREWYLRDNQHIIPDIVELPDDELPERR